MGNKIVKIADFVSPLMIQQDDNTSEAFDAVVDERHDTFIRSVLGVELGNLFLANVDATGVPTDARFVTIFNALQDQSNGYIVESKGMKSMMKSLIWYYFARENNTRVTLSGNVNPKGENSSVSSDNFRLAKAYNDAIDAAKAIQHYITLNLSTYQEYKGEAQHYAHGL